MQNYDLDAHLAELYDHYPEGTSRPVIGIVTNFADQDVTIREVFHKQVIDAGGTPLLIPPTSPTTVPHGSYYRALQVLLASESKIAIPQYSYLFTHVHPLRYVIAFI